MTSVYTMNNERSPDRLAGEVALPAQARPPTALFSGVWLATRSPQGAGQMWFPSQVTTEKTAKARAGFPFYPPVAGNFIKG
jgi:hypothetical protein